MTSIRLKSHVGADGILKLQVPLKIKDVDLEVVMTIEPVLNPEKSGWDPDFFTHVVGGWHGEPLVRAPQGEYEIREELQ